MFRKIMSWLFNTKEVALDDTSKEEAYHNTDDSEQKQSNEMTMSPVRSYLLKAFYDWIVNNNCTPHLVVDTTIKGAQVPTEFIQENNTIILNISPSAVREFDMNKSSVSFLASFSGQHQSIYVPIEAVTSIFAGENHRGMIFEAEDFSQKDEQVTEKKSKFGPKLVVSNKESEIITQHEDN